MEGSTVEVDIDFEERFGCDRWPLHYACRVGNLDHVQYLVDKLHCSIDEADAHDSTPLYLAALTGRNEICRFLLERGAKCDENDGDAARVFYVALTPELRRLLKEWSLSAASRDPFLECLRKAFNDPSHADVSITINSNNSFKRPVCVHRIMLHSRCPHLANMSRPPRGVQDSSDDESVTHQIDLEDRYDRNVAILLLNYLYTGTLDLGGGLDFALESRQMALDWGLTQLAESIDVSISKSNAEKTKSSTSFERKEVRLENIDNSKGLREDMKKLAHLVSTPYSEFESLSDLNLLLEHTDITIQCLESTWSVNRFRLCEQSEYFQRGLLGGFREAQESVFDVSHLLPSPDAWKLVIQWMYSDEFLHEPGQAVDDLATMQDEFVVSVETAVEILELGFAILCPRLSAYVSNAILIPSVDTQNVFGMLSLARMYDKLDRLEDKCVDVVGFNFEHLKHDPALRSLLAEEAAGIVQGGDVLVTDVPICAEISRAIVKHHHDSDETDSYIAFLQNLVQELVHNPDV